MTPSKTGDVNASITSFDAALISRYVAGIGTLDANQQQVADVSGDNSVSSFDAAMIAKFAAGAPYSGAGIGETSTWRFSPASRTYPFILADLTGENYDAFLMGDVSGNWTNSVPSRPAFGGGDPERGECDRCAGMRRSYWRPGGAAGFAACLP